MFGSRVVDEDDDDGAGAASGPSLLGCMSDVVGMGGGGGQRCGRRACRLFLQRCSADCLPSVTLHTPPAVGAYAGASRRVRRLAARGLLRRAAVKPGAIITPRDTWPRFDGGVSMEMQVG